MGLTPQAFLVQGQSAAPSRGFAIGLVAMFRRDPPLGQTHLTVTHKLYMCACVGAHT